MLCKIRVLRPMKKPYLINLISTCVPVAQWLERKNFQIRLSSRKSCVETGYFACNDEVVGSNPTRHVRAVYSTDTSVRI